MSGRVGQTWSFDGTDVVFVVVGSRSRTTAKGERLTDHDILVLIGGQVGGGQGAGPWAQQYKAGEESELREYDAEPWPGKKGKRKLLTRIA